MSSKKMKVREEEIEEEEEVDDEEESQDEEVEDEEAEEDKQITDEDSEEQSEIEERKGPKKKKVREKEAEEEEEVEDDEVDEVQKDKQVTDEESKEESETEENEKKILDLVGPKIKRVREKEEEDKLTLEESEEESKTEEERKKGLKRKIAMKWKEEASKGDKSPKKIKMAEQTEKSETEEEVEDDEVEDEVQEDKQATGEESEEESETEEKGKKILDLVGSKIKRVREKEKDKQLTVEESEVESKTEEERKKGLKRKIAIKWKEEASEGDKSLKKIKMEKQTKKKISNKKNNPHLPLDGDDDDDSEDGMELKYDSDGSLIDDDGKCGVITHPSKCQLSPEEKRKLENLFIQLKHKVLPQHKIEKIAGTRALTKEEKAEFEKYAELRTGKYLPHENKKLRRNWKDFCIANEWNVNNPRPFLQMRYKNKVAFIDFKERMKFVQFLANGLNNRSLYSVFNRFKVLYDPHKVSRYSSSEDDIIIEYIRRYKVSDRERDRKFAELASILKRTRASVWRRYRVLKRKRNIPDDS